MIWIPPSKIFTIIAVKIHVWIFTWFWNSKYSFLPIAVLTVLKTNNIKILLFFILPHHVSLLHAIRMLYLMLQYIFSSFSNLYFWVYYAYVVDLVRLIISLVVAFALMSHENEWWILMMHVFGTLFL